MYIYAYIIYLLASKPSYSLILDERLIDELVNINCDSAF